MHSTHSLGHSMELSCHYICRHLGPCAPQRTPTRRNRLLRPQAPGIPYAPRAHRAGDPCIVGIQAVARSTGIRSIINRAQPKSSMCLLDSQFEETNCDVLPASYNLQ